MKKCIFSELSPRRVQSKGCNVNVSVSMFAGCAPPPDRRPKKLFTLLKGMVHLTQDMTSDDDFGPPE